MNGKGRATYYVPNFAVNNPEIDPDFQQLSTKPDNPGAKPDNLGTLLDLVPDNLKEKIKGLGKKTSDRERMNLAILELCRWRPLTLRKLAILVDRNEKYMFKIITPLRKDGKLEYTIPEMPNHPEQAYKTVEK